MIISKIHEYNINRKPVYRNYTNLYRRLGLFVFIAITIGLIFRLIVGIGSGLLIYTLINVFNIVRIIFTERTNASWVEYIIPDKYFVIQNSITHKYIAVFKLGLKWYSFHPDGFDKADNAIDIHMSNVKISQQSYKIKGGKEILYPVTRVIHFKKIADCSVSEFQTE